MQTNGAPVVPTRPHLSRLGGWPIGLMLALFLVLAAGLLVPGGRLGAAGVGTPGLGATPGTSTVGEPRPGPPDRAALTPTLAATPEATAGVLTPPAPATPRSAGRLSAAIAGPLQLPPVRLTGQDQPVMYPVPITVTDTRGDPGGWQLRLTVTLLVPRQAPGRRSISAPATVTAITAACVAPAPCTLPTSRHVLPMRLTSDDGTMVYQAAPGTGQGTLTITPTVLVVVPASAYAGNYRVTATVAILPAP